MSRSRSNWQIKAENGHNRNHDASKENISKSKTEALQNPGKNLIYPNKRQALSIINENYTVSYKERVDPFANQNAINNADKCFEKSIFPQSTSSFSLNQYVPTSSSIYTTQYHKENFSPHKKWSEDNTQTHADFNIFDTHNLQKVSLNDSNNVSMHSVEDDDNDTPSQFKPLNAPSPMVVVAETTEPIREQPNDIFCVPEYAEDILAYLKESELTHRPRLGYMAKQPDITYSMRATVIDWLVEVACEYKLINKTLHLACSYVDRFLSVMAISRSKLQLLGTTCMLIAAKFEEIYPPDINEFVYITDGTYTKEQVIRMEQLILKILSFRMGPPTILCFLEKFAKMADLPKTNIDLAEYLSELTLLDGETYLKYCPSIVSCAAIALSNLIMRRNPWDTTLQKHSGYAYADFVPCFKELYKSLSNAPLNQQQKAVYEKYSNTKYNEVAKFTAPLPCETLTPTTISNTTQTP